MDISHTVCDRISDFDSELSNQPLPRLCPLTTTPNKNSPNLDFSTWLENEHSAENNDFDALSEINENDSSSIITSQNRSGENNATTSLNTIQSVQLNLSLPSIDESSSNSASVSRYISSFGRSKLIEDGNESDISSVSTHNRIKRKASTDDSTHSDVATNSAKRFKPEKYIKNFRFVPNKQKIRSNFGFI